MLFCFVTCWAIASRAALFCVLWHYGKQDACFMLHKWSDSLRQALHIIPNKVWLPALLRAWLMFPRYPSADGCALYYSCRSLYPFFSWPLIRIKEMHYVVCLQEQQLWDFRPPCHIVHHLLSLTRAGNSQCSDIYYNFQSNTPSGFYHINDQSSRRIVGTPLIHPVVCLESRESILYSPEIMREATQFP